MKKLLDGFAHGVVKHRFIVLAVFVVLIVASAVATFFVKVNSDFFSYLPDDSKTSVGLEKLEENFEMSSTIMLGVDNVENQDDLKPYIEQISALEGVVAGNVTWWGMFEELAGMDGNAMMEELKSNTVIWNIMQNVLERYEIPESQIVSLIDYIGSQEFRDSVQPMFHPYEEMYIIIIQLNVPCASDEAVAVIDSIEDMFAPTPYDIETGGMTDVVKNMFNSTIDELWKYVLIAVFIMFIILFLTTDSLVDPFIFMTTLGISIVLNMGTNILFNLTGTGVSVITYASSTVLQLALSMDYTIFLMHAFAEERAKTTRDSIAMERAIPRTFSTVSASAITTAGGFLALFFMKFKLGGDMGLVLAKGVFLSLLTVIALQPCLMLFTTKLSDKTAHKIYLPKFSKTGSFSIRHRKIIVAVAVALLVPAVILGNMLDITYIKFIEENDNPTRVETTVADLSNSVIVITPVKYDDSQEKFIAKINAMIDEGKVNTVLGAYTMLPEEYHDLLNKLATPELSSMLGMAGNAVPGIGMVNSYVNNNYTLYMIMLSGESESEAAETALAEIHTSMDELFGADTWYCTGMEQAVEDLAAITPTDFVVVSVVSAVIILIVLILTLRSFKFSALVVAVIEMGIFINLAINNLMGDSINFMCYIVLSAVELGATVDYAILFTVKYQRNLEIMSSKEAAYVALRDSGVSVLTSVAIMAGCCLSVAFVTTNIVVGQLCLMIARGSIISGILVLLLLPGLLVVCTGRKRVHKKFRPKNDKKKALTAGDGANAENN